VDRVHALERMAESELHTRDIERLPVLRQRRRYEHTAINLSTAAGLLICAVVALSFVGRFVHPALGYSHALGCFVAMALVFGSLLSFLLETRLATKSIVDTRRLSRRLLRRRNDEDESEPPPDRE